MKITAYHTQAASLQQPDTFPRLAEGYEQWLGDGYYFWQDEYFAKWWGSAKKCGPWNLNRTYIIYAAELEFEEHEFIDTVFNEEDYKHFVSQVERFAKKHQQKLGRKPTLVEFNKFVEDFKLWERFKVIRFQDIPEVDTHLEVKGFFYKKRIQLRVNHASVVKKYRKHKTFACF